MTFAGREQSRTRREPVNLFFFRYGAAPGSYFAYTDGETPVTFNAGDGLGAVLYQPTPIACGEIRLNGVVDKTRFTIAVPHDSEVVGLFNPRPPSYTVSLVVRSGHVGDSEWLVVWSGRILGFSDTKNESHLNGEPVLRGLKRAILRRNYQIQCPHVLYGGQCKANKAAATVTPNVLGLAGAILHLPAGWNGAHPTDRFVGGLAEWIGSNGRAEWRTIIRIADATHVVMGAGADNLTIGGPIALSRNCGKDIVACNEHANIQNFGGHWLIPEKNPTGLRNSYY